MRRLVIIGIDGMDADFVDAHLGELPVLRALRPRGYGGPLRSVFPTDSIPSWITIFTGIPPVEHGILDAIDYYKKDHKDFAIDTSVFRGRTFWDVASAAGRRVGIVNPFMAFPPWPVNGVMASGPVFVKDQSERVEPPELAAQLPLPSMGGIVDFPTKANLGLFGRTTLDYTLAQHRFSLTLLRDHGPWDLFFTTYLTLDRIEHFFWRYHDEQDPTYPGRTVHQPVILEFYRLFDRIVGETIEAAGPGADVMVLSDHGHGRRCTKVVNVNEVLRRAGWLKTRARGRNPLHPRRLLQKAKRAAMSALDRLDMADVTYRIAKLVPRARELKKSSFLVEDGATAVYTPHFAGTSACGGVAVDRARVEAQGQVYDAVCDAVIAALRDVRDPRTGAPVFRWIRRREEALGPGACLERYPDLLFLLESEYGTGWDLFGDVVATNTTHRKISGGHKLDGVLYTSLDLAGDSGEELADPPGLADIAPLVLRGLGLPRSPWMRSAATLRTSAR